MTEVSLFEFSDCRINEDSVNEEMMIGVQNGEIYERGMDIEEDIGESCHLGCNTRT